MWLVSHIVVYNSGKLTSEDEIVTLILMSLVLDFSRQNLWTKTYCFTKSERAVTENGSNFYSLKNFFSSFVSVQSMYFKEIGLFTPQDVKGMFAHFSTLWMKKLIQQLIFFCMSKIDLFSLKIISPQRRK